MKKALIVTTVGGFVPKFEMNNVYYKVSATKCTTLVILNI